MKHLLFLLAMVCSITVQAQKHTVTGTIMDGATAGEPLPGAVVVLLNAQDSTQVTGVMAKADGTFSLPVTKPGSYLLRLSYVGYQTQFHPITIAKKQGTTALGTVELAVDAKQMKETEVTAKLAQVEMKEDTFVYNADAFRLPEGATLEELIRKLPGAELNEDGTISINGKTVKKIMLEGKEFFGNDTKMAMKNLSAKAIKKVKAYDRQSDYSRITGIDDGEEETVLDLTVKPGMKEGWNINVDLGAGPVTGNEASSASGMVKQPDAVYSGRLNINRFLDHFQFSLVGSRNNINDRNGRWGRGGGGGITTSDMYGVNVAWENGKKDNEAGLLKVGGNVRYSHSKSESESRTNSETFLNNTTSTFSNSRNESVNKSSSINANARLEWQPDSMTNLMLRPNFSHSESHNRGGSESVTFNDDPYKYLRDPLKEYDMSDGKMIVDADGKEVRVNSNRRSSMSDSRSNSGDADFQLNRRLGKPGRNITLNLGGRYSQSESTSWSRNNIRYYQADSKKPSDFTNQYNLSPSKSYNFQGRISYNEPLTKKLNLQASYQLQHRFSDNDREMYSIDSLLTSDRWAAQVAQGYYTEEQLYLGFLPGLDTLSFLRNAENSQYATYKELNHDGQLMLRYINKFENGQQLRLNAGLNFQPQTTHMDYEKGIHKIDTARHTFNWAPRVDARWKISNTSQLRLRYNASMNQPSMTNLMEISDTRDPLNISTGNRGLQSSWSNRFFAFYNGYNPERQRGWMINANYNNTRNSISTATVYNTATGGHYSRPMNINGNWSTGGAIMFNTALDAKKTFNINTFTNVNYNHNVGYMSSNSDGTDWTGVFDEKGMVDMDKLFKTVPLQQAITRNTSINENLRVNYRNEFGANKDYSLEVGVNGRCGYQHARSRLRQSANMDTWSFDYGGNVIFSTPFHLSFSSDISQQSRRGYEDKTMNTDELIWNAQLSQSLRKWIKQHDLTISLEWNDILHQRSSISRAISATRRSDTWSNAIHSYFMVHLIYKLDLRGNKEARQNLREGSDGPRPDGPRPDGPRGEGGRGGGRPEGGRPMGSLGVPGGRI